MGKPLSPLGAELRSRPCNYCGAQPAQPCTPDQGGTLVHLERWNQSDHRPRERPGPTARQKQVKSGP